jgi:4-amino-4-deoxy-L-arabinose transferase-like glycosyltransferase
MRTAAAEQEASPSTTDSAPYKRAASRIYFAAATCALAVYLALAVGTALTSRPITDEGLFADPAYTLATRGYMGSPVLRENPRLLRISAHTYWIFPLDPVMQAGWYKVFGVGLFSMRAMSICFGLLGLGALFFLVERLARDALIAALATTLAALDYLYIYGSASGRMDIICASLGYAGLAAYMLLRERNLGIAVLVSQSLVVASGMTHPNGFLYFMGLVFLTLYFDRRRITWRQVLLAAAPYVVGASLWGAYISKDPQAFLAQIRSNAHDGGRLQDLHNPLLGFAREVTVRYATAYGFAGHSAGHEGPIYLKSLALLAYLIGIFGVLWVPSLRKRTETRVLVSLIAIYFVFLAVSDGQKAYYYLVHFIPMYAALLALFLAWLVRERKVKVIMVSVPLAAIIAVQLGGLGYRIHLNSYKNIYQPAVHYLQQNARPSQLINANVAFVFGLNFPNNLVDDSHLRQPADFFVVDNEVAERLRNARTGNPATYQHVTESLRTCYEKVYDFNSIRIYSRKSSDCMSEEKIGALAASTDDH